jgi:hypothetical protein
MVEMESCIRWCREFLNAALNRDDVSPAEFHSEQTYQFPDFEPYEYETEQIYQWTNFDSNTKKDITKRLEALREQIDIDAIGTVTSKMVFPIMRKLQEQGL